MSRFIDLLLTSSLAYKLNVLIPAFCILGIKEYLYDLSRDMLYLIWIIKFFVHFLNTIKLFLVFIT